MRIDGYWLDFEDGITRPVIRASVWTGASTWVEVLFLLDAGADRTVFGAGVQEFLAGLAVSPQEAPQVGGVGGRAHTFFAQTRIRFVGQGEREVSVTGPFGVF